MIFMKPRERSSRTTGPKIRVPIGTTDILCGANDDRAMHVTLLHLAAGSSFLDADDDDVAHAGEATLRPAQHLDALHPLRAAVICDVEIGLHLDH
jgi:hypothetical protein